LQTVSKVTYNGPFENSKKRECGARRLGGFGELTSPDSCTTAKREVYRSRDQKSTNNQKLSWSGTERPESSVEIFPPENWGKEEIEVPKKNEDLHVPDGKQSG